MNFTEGAGIAIDAAPAESIVPNFGMTQFNFEEGKLGVVFEDGVPQACVRALAQIVREKLGELPMVMSPSMTDRVVDIVRKQLLEWAECQYLVRDLRLGEWIFEVPK